MTGIVPCSILPQAYFLLSYAVRVLARSPRIVLKRDHFCTSFVSCDTLQDGTQASRQQPYDLLVGRDLLFAGLARTSLPWSFNSPYFEALSRVSSSNSWCEHVDLKVGSVSL